MDTIEESKFWTQRYEEQRTGWDIGYPSTPIKNYIDQLEDQSINILIPGAGNAWEGEYFFRQGFTNVHILDISAIPLKEFSKRVPEFPAKQLIQANFFEFQGQFDLIIEQTFFCSFRPEMDNRPKYAHKMADLLKPKGKLAGLWFGVEFDSDGRPFGGTREEYLDYFNPYFEVKTFEACYNSIKPREGTELFGIFEKK